ncbi:MAG: alpha/beta hydrolase, partial [Planctomycetaceae bacterium]|nr:alpha/beta hydrolase [Planctomycetaceae bacterium]
MPGLISRAAAVIAVVGVYSTSVLSGRAADTDSVSFGPSSFVGAAWTYPPDIPDATVEVYKQVGDIKLQAWILHPDQDQYPTARPAVVFFFGGGWRSGTPMQFLHQARYLRSRGVTAFLCDYRVASRHDVKAVDCVEDAKSAIRWVRQHAERLHLNPNQICAAGGSAGGHTACATGLLPEFDASDEDLSISSVPNAMALYNPAVMLAPLADVDVPDTESTRFEELKPRLGVESERISPIHHVRPGLPPCVIFHGMADPTVPFATVEEITRRMLAAGNEQCVLHGYKGAPHGFFNWRGGAVAPGVEDLNRDNQLQWNLRTTRQLDQFLQDLGWLTAPDQIAIVDNDNVRLRGSLSNSRAVFTQ